MKFIRQTNKHTTLTLYPFSEELMHIQYKLNNRVRAYNGSQKRVAIEEKTSFDCNKQLL